MHSLERLTALHTINTYSGFQTILKPLQYGSLITLDLNGKEEMGLAVLKFLPLSATCLTRLDLRFVRAKANLV
jgi:hypothetical protein